MTDVMVTGYFDRSNLGDDWMRDCLAGMLDDEAAVSWEPMPSLSPRAVPELWRYLGQVGRSDVLVMSGGTHYTDARGWQGVRVLAQHALLHAYARARRVRIVLLGVGIGPFRRRAARRLAALVMAGADRIVARDEPSRAEAIALGVPVGGTVLGCDLVLGAHQVARTVRAVGVSPSTGTVAIRHVVVNVALHGSGTDVDLVADAVAGALRRVTAACDEPMRVSALVMFSAPGASDERAAQRLLATAWRPNDEVVLARPTEPAGLLALLADADLVIASRYHACIGALVAGTPLVAIAYEDKVHALAAESGDAHTSLVPVGSASDVAALAGAMAAALTAEATQQRTDIPDARRAALVSEIAAITKGRS